MVRDVASWCGNVMLAKGHPDFPSDVVLCLAAAGASITIGSSTATTTATTTTTADDAVDTAADAATGVAAGAAAMHGYTASPPMGVLDFLRYSLKPTEMVISVFIPYGDGASEVFNTYKTMSRYGDRFLTGVCTGECHRVSCVFAPLAVNMRATKWYFCSACSEYACDQMAFFSGVHFLTC
jgi:hypothetical protein